MKPEKLIKKEMIKEASSKPEKYFPVETLKNLELTRQTCTKCSTKFWSSVKRDICGDTNCVGSYTFIGNTPAKSAMSFPQTYKKWRKFIEKRGYKHVNRFPIVARWRDDLDFNIASIIGFQPYVTKGEVAPPAEEITIPQNCLRFGDIDNVGYTGRHFTSFTMIGQTTFKKPNEYDQAKYVKDLFDWFTLEMGISKDEIQIHEDAWVGGGDCGPSMEFFSRGLELGNQVYMWYDMSSAKNLSEIKPLKIKVLDMGMGQERCCWFSQGTSNSYDAVMPRVCKYLFEKADFKPNWDLYNKFLPYSGLLNLDEVEDIEKAWEDVRNAMKTNLTIEELKTQIEPIAGIYSIADHTRSLLYALTDGALPSNVKGGYNLRLILRRSLDFITKYNWDINLYDTIVLQAEELTEQYPELKNELVGIKKIIDMEVEKYNNHKIKVENKIQSLIKKDKKISTEDFIKLYISDGITPFEIENAAKKEKKHITIPSNFFTLVTEYFESNKISDEKQAKNELLKYIEELPDTKMLFYEDTYKKETESKILKEFTHNNKIEFCLVRCNFYYCV
jgi:alanyl-tRNA synthetase